MVKFTRKRLSVLLADYDNPDSMAEREDYLDYLTEIATEPTPFSDLLEEADLSFGDIDEILSDLHRAESGEPARLLSDEKPAPHAIEIALLDIDLPF